MHPSPNPPSAPFTADQIIYEDNHLIAVCKRPSQIVQGDKTGDEPLSESIKAYIAQRDGKPGNVFLGVVHRLDRPVGGVILFAKTGKALSRLNRLVQERAFQKTYWAIAGQRPPKPADRLVHYLRRDETRNKSFVCASTRKDAKEAVLDYRVIAASERYYLLEIQLHTGRHHQIRAQLAAIGCPIKGDLKYGFPRSNPDQSISLHARSLALIHPVAQTPLLLTAEPPADKLWQCLKAQVQG
ncbi:MAG: RluA family pseudouridine synthase [Bacteroidales bacterium]|nr:RluA family pseudouridine synthase [Bacteroidales bacterium]